MSTEKDFIKAAQSFRSLDVASPVLKAGEHAVRLVNAAVIHSGVDNKGNPKDRDVDYDDVTPQVYCEFGSVKGEGAIAHRFNLLGYLKYENLTAKEKESGKFEPSEGPEGYALKNGQRIQDEENTAAAHRILSQAFKAMGLPVGSEINDLEQVIEDRTEFIAVVRDREYNEKTYTELHYLKAVKQEAPVTETSFD